MVVSGIFFLQFSMHANDLGPEGGGHFHSKVIGMLLVFLGYKILIFVFFRVFWKILEN